MERNEVTQSQSQVALVQGASRGVGLEFTRQLLERRYVSHVIATCRKPEESDALAQLGERSAGRLSVVRLDVADEKSIIDAVGAVKKTAERLHLLINCAGILHDESGVRPEKRLESVDPDILQRVFEVNAFGPLLMAKHFHPFLRHADRSVLANLSARVGSIGDDRSGGWYAYRGSKAAQNMFTKNTALELARRAPRCICVALHPGTVETELSRPFRGRIPADKLFSVERAAGQLLDVMDRLKPKDSGSFFAWDGTPIPW
jgi:NAD(P)-dependent dehydrogenase (short-subunit alcohol dehydrogenase family)